MQPQKQTKKCNLSKIVSVLLSASVKSFFVSHMQDFCQTNTKRGWTKTCCHQIQCQCPIWNINTFLCNSSDRSDSSDSCDSRDSSDSSDSSDSIEEKILSLIFELHQAALEVELLVGWSVGDLCEKVTLRVSNGNLKLPTYLPMQQ